MINVFQHICRSLPCRKSLKAPGMLRTTTGKAVSWDSHPSEDRSEPPLQRRNGSIIIPNFSIIASSRTTRLFSLSVDRSLLYGRSWRQKTSRFEKRGKIRSTELFSFQGASEAALSLFTIQRTFFTSFWGSLQKNFLLFSAHLVLPQRQS